MQQFYLIVADDTILDAIVTSHLSRLNDSHLSLSVFLFGQKLCVVAPHSQAYTSNYKEKK